MTVCGRVLSTWTTRWPDRLFINIDVFSTKQAPRRTSCFVSLDLQSRHVIMELSRGAGFFSPLRRTEQGLTRVVCLYLLEPTSENEAQECRAAVAETARELGRRRR